MDSLIAAAARALAAGDPLGALNPIALRSDAPALALRGIAMAQLGELERAKLLLRRAARAFGSKEAVARARCIVAEAEIALAARDLHWPIKALDAASLILDTHGDRINAMHARYIDIRRLLLLGRLDEAELALAGLDNAPLPMLEAVRELLLAGIALRRLRAQAARAALVRAKDAAHRAGIPPLIAEIESAFSLLKAPAARLLANGEERMLLLDDVESLLASKALVVDACRHVVLEAGAIVSLATRPLLFALAHALAEAWPEEQSRELLIERLFRTKHGDESHRARLRVEIGRLRALIEPFADIGATARGFILRPRNATSVVVLLRPVDEKHAAVLALLADGQAWSSSALALVLGTSQRTVQRALDELAVAGAVQSFGRGRARRWITPPLPGFATILLLPASMPAG